VHCFNHFFLGSFFVMSELALLLIVKSGLILAVDSVIVLTKLFSPSFQKAMRTVQTDLEYRSKSYTAKRTGLW
jgi:hypothetical protein